MEVYHDGAFYSLVKLRLGQTAGSVSFFIVASLANIKIVNTLNLLVISNPTIPLIHTMTFHVAVIKSKASEKLYGCSNFVESLLVTLVTLALGVVTGYHHHCRAYIEKYPSKPELLPSCHKLDVCNVVNVSQV